MVYGINLEATKASFLKTLEAYRKSLTHYVATRSQDNISGSDTITYASGVTIYGAFFRQQDQWVQNKPGLLQGADAILIVEPTVTIAKDDKIEFDSEVFQILDADTRYVAEVAFYTVSRLYKKGGSS